MSIVFFEGFNISSSDVKKLDTDYWSIPNNDIHGFGTGRTDNCILLKSSPYMSGMSQNKKLELSNFTSPLTSENAFGLGFFVDQIKQNESKLITIHNGASEVLSIDVITTTYNSTSSIGLDIKQNGSSVTTYDLKSPLGYTYSIQDSFYADSAWRQVVNQGLYFEFYVDPKDTLTLRARVNGLDMLNSSSVVSTAISGFTNIDKISFYGGHDNAANNENSHVRKYDDLYLTSGTGINDTLLGSNTKIYRLTPNGNTSTNEWNNTNNGGPPHSYIDVSDNNGDASYIYASTSGTQSLFQFGDVSTGPSLPSNVGGVKILNTARKLTQDSSFINIYASGNNQTISEFGPQYNLDSTIYDYYNSFLFKNPQTNNDWTVSDINDMQIGVKKL